MTVEGCLREIGKLAPETRASPHNLFARQGDVIERRTGKKEGPSRTVGQRGSKVD